MTPERFQELLDAYVDQTLTPAEKIELEQNLISSKSASKEFWRHVEFHAQIRELILQAEGEQKLPVVNSESYKKTSFLSWAVPLAAAATIMMIVGGWWLNGLKTEYTVARVDHVQGTANARIKSSNTSQGIRAGDKIGLETMIKTGSDGEVKLVYGDGVADVLVGKNSTLLTAKSNAEKSLHLETGRLTVKVTKQPKDAPFMLATPHAVMKVVGTQFEVIANETLTQLKVTEGEVRLQKADNTQVNVRAGFMAEATAGRSMNPVPIDGVAGRKLREGAIFFRDFETIFPGENSRNELVILQESEGEVTAMVSSPRQTAALNKQLHSTSLMLK
jgi:hypothetical protein